VSPFDSVTALWALITIAVAVVAFALGYLLGEADHLRTLLHREKDE
jgi:hypothetical protein